MFFSSHSDLQAPIVSGSVLFCGVELSWDELPCCVRYLVAVSNGSEQEMNQPYYSMSFDGHPPGDLSLSVLCVDSDGRRGPLSNTISATNFGRCGC